MANETQPTPTLIRNLTLRIEALEQEKFGLPYDWLRANKSVNWPEAERATADRCREILDELKALRAERKAGKLALREERENRRTTIKARRESERSAITVECQICERRQCKDAQGRLVHHGYLRPGDGAIEGDCPGVGHYPYPATDELERYLRAVASALTSTADSIAGLPTRETIVKADRNATRGNRFEVVTFHKAEVDAYTWGREVEQLKWELESRLRHLRSEVDRATRRIATAKEARP